jgi:hypothetical protein
MRGSAGILSPRLSPRFSLQDSEFGAFLYAPIGEEENGMVLTTLSALARVGVDPWQEAARLAQLPVDAASQRLTSMISGLPNGRWVGADAGTIATRLIALLPAPKAPQAPSRGTAPGNRPLTYWVAVFAVFVVLNSALLFMMRSHEPSAVIDNGYGAASTTNTQPEAPLFDPNGKRPP